MYPQRCTDDFPHGPHRVEACGTRTGFTCAGHDPAEVDALDEQAFGAASHELHTGFAAK
jgi:hypothetical protein